MNEILPGIYQLQIPIPDNPLGHTNVYLVKGTDSHLLIDAGYGNTDALQALQNQLNEINVNLKDISHVIATHVHFDHYGLTDKLRQLSGAKIALHPIDKKMLAPKSTGREDFIRRAEHWFNINGVPAGDFSVLPTPFSKTGDIFSPGLPDIDLISGEEIGIANYKFQVIWTPGHSPGHVCLYEPHHKFLFAGDHVLPVITPNVSLQPQSDTNPLGDFVNSLQKVKELDVNLVLPAHEHIFTNLAERVDEIILHHEQRNSEILTAIGSGQKTAYQISQQITWMPELGGVQYQDMAPMDKRLAIAETLSHLEAMRVDTRVGQVNRDSIIYYRRT